MILKCISYSINFTLLIKHLNFYINILYNKNKLLNINIRNYLKITKNQSIPFTIGAPSNKS